ncbi:hypothetical protein Cgig2_014118 [Carnegiea gigantea]|uniref:Peptidase A2 domain-containing protein n=1 Tax=Carnegiea gigantea TaxID=171969 RepID=A0A9Q1KUW3_9CARY|nr:hypothetical protein Cgig2_014118 [Carnegiea gigantea]
MEAANSARSLLHFDYVLTHGGEPSHRPEWYHLPVIQSESGRYLGRIGAVGTIWSSSLDAQQRQRPNQQLLPLLMQPIPGESSGSRNRNRFPSLGGRSQVRGPILRRLPPITVPLKPQNARKYCEFYEQSGHTTTECRELKRALHELVDKGQIAQFLKRGPRFLRREQEPAQPLSRDEECSTEVVSIIAGGYAERMTRSAWKPQLRSAQQVLTTEQGPRTMVPTMVFGGKEAPRFAYPHNDPLVVEMKIASVIVRRILIDTGSSIDIITWDSLKKLTHPGRDIVPLVHPILVFGGQEVNPTGMICLPMRFSDKLKSKNLEVEFLIVDVPTANNVILGRPTLHKRRWYRDASSSSLWHSAVALIPRANASAIVTSSSVILVESEVPKALGGRTAGGLRSSSHGLRGGFVPGCRWYDPQLTDFQIAEG